MEIKKREKDRKRKRRRKRKMRSRTMELQNGVLDQWSYRMVMSKKKGGKDK